MSYQIVLESFTGPFDLLLHLIDKNEVDIYDIPIAQITQQYLDYLQTMESLDLDIASEFIVMAATLLNIKARMLLPSPAPASDDEEQISAEDPRQELVHNLLQYRLFKNMASFLAGCHEEQSLLVARPNEEELYAAYFSEENPLQGKTLEDLQNAFTRICAQAVKRNVVFTIKKEGVHIQSMIDDIKNWLRRFPRGITLETLFQNDSSRLQLVVRFLAILELIRLKAIRVQQSGIYGDIYLFPVNLTIPTENT